MPGRGWITSSVTSSSAGGRRNRTKSGLQVLEVGFRAVSMKKSTVGMDFARSRRHALLHTRAHPEVTHDPPDRTLTVGAVNLSS